MIVCLEKRAKLPSDWFMNTRLENLIYICMITCGISPSEVKRAAASRAVFH